MALWWFDAELKTFVGQRSIRVSMLSVYQCAHSEISLCIQEVSREKVAGLGLKQYMMYRRNKGNMKNSRQ